MDVEEVIAEFDGVFIAALRADMAPAAPLALFWFEGIGFKREAENPSAISRGTAFLHYQKGGRILGDVPNQGFAAERLPTHVCQSLISEHAASWDGPRSLSFRYDLTETGWTGGGAWESSSTYRELVLSRRALDDEMSDALGALWTPSTLVLSLNYGSTMKDDPGPRLRVKTSESNEFQVLPDHVMNVWRQYEPHGQKFGHHHLYSTQMTLKEPGGRLREGDNLYVRYGR